MVSSTLEKALSMLLQLGGMPHDTNMLEVCDMALRCAWSLASTHKVSSRVRQVVVIFKIKKEENS